MQKESVELYVYPIRGSGMPYQNKRIITPHLDSMGIASIDAPHYYTRIGCYHVCLLVVKFSRFLIEDKSETLSKNVCHPLMTLQMY